MLKLMRGIFVSLAWLFVAGIAVPGAFAQDTLHFSSGNLVVVLEGNGVEGSSGSYTDNQAAPLTLFQYQLDSTNPATTAPTYVNSLVLPQTASGNNSAISGEYGSSSEGTVQLAGSGQYLTLMGYGVNAAAFNASPATYSSSGNAALAQSDSLTGQSYTPVPRVVALVDPYGNVNTSTQLYNIFDTNNPRSTYTADGVKIYVSGQGTGSDTTGGVFYTTIGATAATAITGADSGSGVSQDTRDVQIYNNTLYVSVDSKEGSTNRDYLGTLGTPPSTSLFNSAAGPTQLTMANNASTPVAISSKGKLTLTSSEYNTVNSGVSSVNISPVNYFFANAYTLYVADSGSPKNTSGTSTLGAGGLQKWVNTKTDGSGTWELQYTLSKGLSLVANSTANSSNTSGTTGLYGLTGVISGTNVYLFATNYTISDLDQTYLYGITDTLASTTSPGTSFTVLATAPADSNFKGVAFSPTLAAGSATITSTPSGVSLTTSGTGCVPGSYSTPVTLIWTQSSTCTLSIGTPSAATGTQYVFSQWSDGTTTATDTVTAPTSSAVYNAVFTTQYQLTTAAGTGGTVSSGGYYTAGSDAAITATPNSGYYFSGWTSSPDAVASSTAATTTITMNAAESVTANFAVAGPATLSSPTSGSTLSGASTTFTWSANGSTTPVYLWVGSTAGAYDLVNVGPLSGTSTTVTLPTNGATVYATLWSTVNGSLVSSTATYTEASVLPASLASPTTGSTLNGASTTFTWTANGSTKPVYLWVGTSAGGLDLVNIGPLSGTSTTVTLPTNGATVYATLWSTVNGSLVSSTATYTEASVLPATLTSPTTGSTLSGASTTFTWSANGSTTPVYLWVGTSAGAYDLVNIGPLSGTSTTVTLPTNGATVYATLWSTVNGTLVSKSYSYTEASIAPAQITSPASGSQLSSTQTFTYAYNQSTDPVYLWLGTSAGAYDVANIGPLTGGTVTLTLPTDGVTVYATLWSTVNGSLTSKSYVYVDPSAMASSVSTVKTQTVRRK
ncbi:MAG: hypothetical protein P4M01_07160 [Acidobacteriota bacterium]|nr:hypothetical protein [Acidobacteriota bacterium]